MTDHPFSIGRISVTFNLTAWAKSSASTLRSVINQANRPVARTDKSDAATSGPRLPPPRWLTLPTDRLVVRCESIEPHADR